MQVYINIPSCIYVYRKTIQYIIILHRRNKERNGCILAIVDNINKNVKQYKTA